MIPVCECTVNLWTQTVRPLDWVTMHSDVSLIFSTCCTVLVIIFWGMVIKKKQKEREWCDSIYWLTEVSLCLCSSVWHAPDEGALPHPTQPSTEAQVQKVVSGDCTCTFPRICESVCFVLKGGIRRNARQKCIICVKSPCITTCYLRIFWLV